MPDEFERQILHQIQARDGGVILVLIAHNNEAWLNEV
jgi:hypothetical protein